MRESTEALICVDVAMFVVVLSAGSENLLCGWRSTAPHRFPKSLRGKWANPELMEFARQGHASRHRTAHSTRFRYWSNSTIFPSHSVPDELVITTTFGTSHGPTQPLIVNCTRFSRPRFRHSLFSHSTGTSGKPRSTFPQQHPRQIVICPTTRRFVFNGQSRSSFTA